MKKTVIAVIVLFVMTGAICFAGAMWKLKCEDPKCQFSAGLDIGGVTAACQVSGYCTACKEFVTISWKRPDLTGDFKKAQDQQKKLGDKPPPEIGTVWNPATGLTVALYSCPQCKKPFMENDSISFMRARREGLFCPRCTNLTLRVDYVGRSD